MTPSPLSPQQLDELDGLLAAREAGGDYMAAMRFVTDAPGAMRALLATVRRQQAVIDAVTELAKQHEAVADIYRRVENGNDKPYIRADAADNRREAEARADDLRTALASPAPTDATT